MFSLKSQFLSDRMAAGKVQALKHNPAPPSSNKSAVPHLAQPDKPSVSHQDLHIQCEFGSKKALELTSNHFEFPRAGSGLLGLMLVIFGGSKAVAFAC